MACSACFIANGRASRLFLSVMIAAKLRETFAPHLRNEAELGKVGSERIDQLRALTD